MQMVDLSHTMNVHTPGWVGYAGNKMYYAQNLQTQRIVAQRIDTALHVGTHFDGALHATDGRGDMASYPLEYLVGKGAIVDVAEHMWEAVGAVSTAVVDRGTDGWEGAVEGSVIAAGSNLSSVVAEVVDAIRNDDHEILTLVGGEALASEELEELVSKLGGSVDGLQIGVHRGDQRTHPLELGLE